MALCKEELSPVSSYSEMISPSVWASSPLETETYASRVNLGTYLEI